MTQEYPEFYMIEVDGVLSFTSANVIKAQVMRSAKTAKFYHPKAVINLVKATIGDVKVIKEIKNA